jgi:hypothetical protein
MPLLADVFEVVNYPNPRDFEHRNRVIGVINANTERFLEFTDPQSQAFQLLNLFLDGIDLWRRLVALTKLEIGDQPNPFPVPGNISSYQYLPADQQRELLIEAISPNLDYLLTLANTLINF